MKYTKHTNNKYTSTNRFSTTQISSNAFSYRPNGTKPQIITTITITTIDGQNSINNTDGIKRLLANGATTCFFANDDDHEYCQVY